MATFYTQMRTAPLASLLQLSLPFACGVMYGLMSLGMKADRSRFPSVLVLCFAKMKSRPNFYFPTNLDLNKIDGYLEVFRGSGKNWSYVRSHPSGNNQVAETAEKVQISNLCCTGLYYFRETSSFRKAYAVETSNHNLREYYVAPLYNHLIAEGAQIFYHEILPSNVTFCGIPEEYEALKIQQEIRNGG